MSAILYSVKIETRQNRHKKVKIKKNKGLSKLRKNDTMEWPETEGLLHNIGSTVEKIKCKTSLMPA